MYENLQLSGKKYQQVYAITHSVIQLHGSQSSRYVQKFTQSRIRLYSSTAANQAGIYRSLRNHEFGLTNQQHQIFKLLKLPPLIRQFNLAKQELENTTKKVILATLKSLTTGKISLHKP